MPTDAMAPATPSKHILVVDDDRDVVEFIRLVLDQFGYLVDCVKNGNEALAIFKPGA